MVEAECAKKAAQDAVQKAVERVTRMKVHVKAFARLCFYVAVLYPIGVVLVARPKRPGAPFPEATNRSRNRF